jgi:hypothetical protein
VVCRRLRIGGTEQLRPNRIAERATAAADERPQRRVLSRMRNRDNLQAATTLLARVALWGVVSALEHNTLLGCYQAHFAAQDFASPTGSTGCFQSAHISPTVLCQRATAAALGNGHLDLANVLVDGIGNALAAALAAGKRLLLFHWNSWVHLQ